MTEERSMKQVIDRLDRLEGKVDNMATALVEIAKTEERVVRLMESDNEKTKWIRTLQDRVVELEKKEMAKDALSRRAERGVWVLITSGVSAIVGVLVAFFSSNGG